MSPAAFTQAAARYRQANVVTVPCGGETGKTPLIRHQGLRRPAGESTVVGWSERLRGANIGILTGPSRLTVVDCDDGALIDEMIRRCGESPFIVRTPRGGAHLYYQSAGEPTITGLDGMKVDLRGIGGLIIAPPSIGPNGRAYRLVEGRYADLHRLPFARQGSLPKARRSPFEQDRIPEGVRNSKLFQLLLRESISCDTVDELHNIAGVLNERCDPPLSDNEVTGIVCSVWRYEQEGRNWAGRESSISWSRSEFLALAPAPDALVLLGVLRFAHQRKRAHFAVSPSAMAREGTIEGWSEYRIRLARDQLVRVGALKQVHRSRRPHDPNLYQLVCKSVRSEHNTNRTCPR
jgi:hypothetical protein